MDAHRILLFQHSWNTSVKGTPWFHDGGGPKSFPSLEPPSNITMAGFPQRQKLVQKHVTNCHFSPTNCFGKFRVYKIVQGFVQTRIRKIQIAHCPTFLGVLKFASLSHGKPSKRRIIQNAHNAEIQVCVFLRKFAYFDGYLRIFAVYNFHHFYSKI